MQRLLGDPGVLGCVQHTCRRQLTVLQDRQQEVASTLQLRRRVRVSRQQAVGGAIDLALPREL
jgi:hypothetical protein